MLGIDYHGQRAKVEYRPIARITHRIFTPGIFHIVQLEPLSTIGPVLVAATSHATPPPLPSPTPHSHARFSREVELRVADPGCGAIIFRQSHILSSDTYFDTKWIFFL